MLELTIPATRVWDETNEEFIIIKETHLKLEHSLVSVEKFEEKNHIHFLDNENITEEQFIDYIKCMTITQNVDPNVYKALDNEHFIKIRDYMADPMTATKISKSNNQGISNEYISAELIYYWMISLNIPIEFRKWHINKLLTLISVCSIKNQPPKKQSQEEVMARHRAVRGRKRIPKK